MITMGGSRASRMSLSSLVPVVFPTVVDALATASGLGGASLGTLPPLGCPGERPSPPRRSRPRPCGGGR